jgi:hypothetical protein
VALWGTGEGIQSFLWGNLRERDHLEHLVIDGRIILKWIFKKQGGGRGLVCSGPGEGQVAGCCYVVRQILRYIVS